VAASFLGRCCSHEFVGRHLDFGLLEGQASLLKTNSINNTKQRRYREK
jgi:hypothetical protein